MAGGFLLEASEESKGVATGQAFVRDPWATATGLPPGDVAIGAVTRPPSPRRSNSSRHGGSDGGLKCQVSRPLYSRGRRIREGLPCPAGRHEDAPNPFQTGQAGFGGV